MITQFAIYKWYILRIGLSYATYHLLREPETAIDKWMAIRFQVPESLVGILRRVAFTMLADFSSEKKLAEILHTSYDYFFCQMAKEIKKTQNPKSNLKFIIFFPTLNFSKTSTFLNAYMDLIFSSIFSGVPTFKACI